MKKQKFVKICPYCGNEIYDFIRKDEEYRCRCCKQMYGLSEVIREKVNGNRKRK